MKRYLRFFPVMLAALALAAGGSTMILRQVSAQKGGAQPGGPQKGGPQKGAPTLSVEAQRQIRALLDEKQNRSAAQRKVSAQLLYASRARRGQAMTQGGEVRALNSAMPMARPDKDGRVLVNIKADLSKQFLMTVEKFGGEIISTSEKGGMIRALVPLDLLEELANDTAVKYIRSANFEAATRNHVIGSGGTGLTGMAT